MKRGACPHGACRGWGRGRSTRRPPPPPLPRPCRAVRFGVGPATLISLALALRRELAIASAGVRSAWTFRDVPIFHGALRSGLVGARQGRATQGPNAAARAVLKNGRGLSRPFWVSYAWPSRLAPLRETVAPNDAAPGEVPGLPSAATCVSAARWSSKKSGLSLAKRNGGHCVTYSCVSAVGLQERYRASHVNININFNFHRISLNTYIEPTLLRTSSPNETTVKCVDAPKGNILKLAP